MHKKGHKGSKAFPKAGKLGKNTIPVGALLGGTADVIGSTMINMGAMPAIAAASAVTGIGKPKKILDKGMENMGKAADRLRKTTSPETYGSQSTGGDINFSLQTGDWLKTSRKIREHTKRIESNKPSLLPPRN